MPNQQCQSNEGNYCFIKYPYLRKAWENIMDDLNIIHYNVIMLQPSDPHATNNFNLLNHKLWKFQISCVLNATTTFEFQFNLISQWNYSKWLLVRFVRISIGQTGWSYRGPSGPLEWPPWSATPLASPMPSPLLKYSTSLVAIRGRYMH